jgi:hypothetical protein
MKRKFTLNSKLKAYSALAGSLIAAGNAADASIVYHDVNPDSTTTQSSNGVSNYAIDMNTDGTDDFTISVFIGNKAFAGFSGSGTEIYLTPASSNDAVAGKSTTVVTTTITYVSALNANDNISSALSWYSGGGSPGTFALAAKITSPYPTTFGQFANTTDKYIGVKFTANSNTYYGWIRLDVGNYNTFTVKDWAYENTPGQAILAGQTTTTGINTYLSAATTIKNINNIIEAEFAGAVQGKVQIVNISGSVVRSADVNGTTCSINMQGMPSGIYNVVISSKEGTATKKVFVE